MANNRTFTHKGYCGNIDFNIEDGVLHGKIQCITDLVTYEAETLQQLEAEFIDAVDDYLETCEEIGKNPDKPMTGSFNVRIGSELHKKLHLRSVQNETSINDEVKKAVANYFDEDKGLHMHVHINKPEQKTAEFQYELNEKQYEFPVFNPKKATLFEFNKPKKPDEVKH